VIDAINDVERVRLALDPDAQVRLGQGATMRQALVRLAPWVNTGLGAMAAEHPCYCRARTFPAVTLGQGATIHHRIHAALFSLAVC
jgi:hypothetical protein